MKKLGAILIFLLGVTLNVSAGRFCGKRNHAERA